MVRPNDARTHAERRYAADYAEMPGIRIATRHARPVRRSGEFISMTANAPAIYEKYLLPITTQVSTAQLLAAMLY